MGREAVQGLWRKIPLSNMDPGTGGGARSESVQPSRAIWLAHLLGLPLAVALGLGLCGRDLGWSDSLVIARSPVLHDLQPSVAEYTRYWYTHLNGRAAQGAVASLARLPFARAASPERFPFWLYAGLSFFCALQAAVLCGACVARVRRAPGQGALVTAAVGAVWATNPVSFANITYHHLAIFLAYLLAAYLTALWFWHALGLASASASRGGLALHLLGYLFLSAYGEIVLLSIPLLGVLAWAAGSRAPRSSVFWLRVVGAYTALSAAAAAVYWFSPGQRYRVRVLGVGLPTADAGPLVRTLELVPVRFFGLSPALGLALYAAVALSIALLLAMGGRTRRLATAAGVLFVAHAAALAPALSVDLPPRTAIYPALLFVTCVSLLVLAAVEWLAGRGRENASRPSPRRGALALAACGLLGCAVAARQIREDVRIQAERREFFTLRQRVYEYVLGVHDYGGASAFVLTDCDLAPDGTAIEPPWGLQAYFSWARTPPLQVFIDTNYDFAERPPALVYAQVSCRRFVRRSAS